MVSYPDAAGRINLFSLVAYVPEPLGSFLDGLRQELVPSCKLRAHVTVLPPRPISTGVEQAAGQVRAGMRESEPFVVRIRDVEMFSITSVVYLAIREGLPELQRMHELLNAGGLKFDEPYPYHPHVTLAQQITPEQIPAVFEIARRRWAHYPLPREFRVDSVTFVQGTALGTWIDLADCPLGPQPAAP